MDNIFLDVAKPRVKCGLRIDGLAQEYCNTIANTLELQQFVLSYGYIPLIWGLL